MTPKERVRKALRKQPVDRVPVFMWFHPDTARNLAGLLEIPASAVAEAMGNDIFQTWVNNNYAMEGIVHEHEGEGHVAAGLAEFLGLADTIDDDDMVTTEEKTRFEKRIEHLERQREQTHALITEMAHQLRQTQTQLQQIQKDRQIPEHRE
mgnify:CR=1 FL=1